MSEEPPDQTLGKHPDELPVIPGNDKVGDFVVAPHDLYDKSNPQPFDLEFSAQAARDMLEGKNEQIHLVNKARGEEAYNAKHDPLTGLLNRRGLEEAYEKLMSGGETNVSEKPEPADPEVGERQRSTDNPETEHPGHAIVVLDLDDFKSINDRLGHLKGDRTLTAIADELRSFFREDDILARLGGDELVVVLPHTNQEMAQGMIRRLQPFLKSLEVDGRPLSLSFSAGVAKAGPNFTESYNEADAGEGRAKQAGGDQVAAA